MTDQHTPSSSANELARLKDQLLGQMAMLREDRLDELLTSLHDTTQLLAGLTGSQMPTELSRELEEIRTLHAKLGLSVAAQLADTQQRLGRLHKGKRVLRAYRM